VKFPNLTESLGLLDAAIAYAYAGLPVFELTPGGKTPATRHGFYDATSDPQQIPARWSRDPLFNIGMEMGERSGLMVVDADILWGCTESLRRLFAGHEEFETLVVETGGGGHHIYLQYDPRLKSRKDFLPGLELKSDGTYVVVPPSIHPSGDPYRVLFEYDVAPCPEWLVEAIQKAPAGRPEVDLTPDTIPEGDRDVTLASLAGSMHHRGIAFPVIERALQSVNQDLCDPPLPETQVTKIARSISRYPRGSWKTAQRQLVQLRVNGGRS
jgi:putative DNA primase/helicase